MRTIHRDIVGGFIFSKDGKLLLGKNRKGGVYEGRFVVPGGGVDDGETKEEALRREMLEETGIDLNQNASAVSLKTEDDWYEPRWFEVYELNDAKLSEPTRSTLVMTGIITGSLDKSI